MVKEKNPQGRPLKYGEPVKKIIRSVPLSKIQEFELKVDALLKRYEKEYITSKNKLCK